MEEALSETAGNLIRIREKYGARAVGFGVGMPKGLEHFVLIRLANIFGSPNVIASRDVRHAPREITGVHTCGFSPVADLHHPTELMLLWASNVSSTNEEGQIARLFYDQLKGGAKLIVVDPRRTDLIQKAARMYAEARAAALQWGNPIEHDIHVFDATRSLVCLMAICGNLDVAESPIPSLRGAKRRGNLLNVRLDPRLRLGRELGAERVRGVYPE